MKPGTYLVRISVIPMPYTLKADGKWYTMSMFGESEVVNRRIISKLNAHAAKNG